MADRIAFADESGTGGKTKCYGIGVLSYDRAEEAHVDRWIEQFRVFHNVNAELSWEGIRNRMSDINFLLDCLGEVLHPNSIRFDAIIVHTARYNNWSKPGADRETAFYKTYTLLLKY